MITRGDVDIRMSLIGWYSILIRNNLFLFFGVYSYTNLIIDNYGLLNANTIIFGLFILTKRCPSFVWPSCFGGHKSFLWGHWYPFWTSGDVCPVILRFISGVTSADYIEVSMAAEPFWSTYLQMCPQALGEDQVSNPCLSMPHTASTAL